MVIKLHDPISGDRRKDEPSRPEDRTNPNSAAGRDAVERARANYEQEFSRWLNTRGGTLALLRSKDGKKQRLIRQLTNEMPFNVREARAALMQAYTSATADGASISTQDMATFPPDHHEHDHDHDHLHPEDHHHEGEFSHAAKAYAHQIDEHLAVHVALGGDPHKEAHAMERAGLVQKEHGHNPYLPHNPHWNN